VPEERTCPGTKTLYNSAILITYFRCAAWASNLLLLIALSGALRTVSRDTSLASIGGETMVPE
jgi:hypothetical protein